MAGGSGETGSPTGTSPWATGCCTAGALGAEGSVGFVAASPLLQATPTARAAASPAMTRNPFILIIEPVSSMFFSSEFSLETVEPLDFLSLKYTDVELAKNVPGFLVRI